MIENRLSKGEIIKAFGIKGVSPLTTFTTLEDYILFSPEDLRSLGKCYYVVSEGIGQYLFVLETLRFMIEDGHCEFTIVEYEEWEDFVYQKIKAGESNEK